MKKKINVFLLALSLVMATAFMAQAAETIIPQSALVSSGQYYTDIIGGGIGDVVVMTGGSNAANVGYASGRNDDGFSGPIPFGFTFDFFGTSYSSFYANNNGNISFGSGISSYIPSGPTGSSSPVISPYFADVDTRGALSNVMHLRTLANEVIITWDNVGYYGSHDDLLNSFQLIVRGPDYDIPVGEGVIGFFYKDMPWITTDTSSTAAVGFGDGSGNSEVLAGSNTNTINLALSNHYIWFDQNLQPVQTPEPLGILLLGLGLSGIVVAKRKMK